VSEIATYLFDPEAIKRAEEPAEDTVRLFWMFVVLVRERAITYERYAALFSRTTRTFKRDVTKLRELGERFNFALSPQRRGEVRLARFDDDPLVRRRHSDAERADDAVHAVVEAFGEVVAASLRAWTDLPAPLGDRFLRIATPRLRADSTVGATYELFREGWRRRARLRFRYPPRSGGAPTERVVEPYLTTYNAGRYYLVGFDVRPGSGWRQYAIDRIVGPIKPSGTFSARVIPRAYRGEDAVGLFKTGVERDVTVALSATIAQAVIAREWQHGERIGHAADGRITLTFSVHDVGEAVRWALSFGSEAEILAPSDAVAHAREIVATLRDRYAIDAKSRSA